MGRDELSLTFGPLQVSVGLTFALVLVDHGVIYSVGSMENGQLGNGESGRRIAYAGKLSHNLQETPKQIPRKHFTDHKASCTLVPQREAS